MTFFFFNDTATTEIYTLSLHDALPIFCGCDPAIPIFLTSKAQEQGYHPEWIITGAGFIDLDVLGQLYQQDQWSRSLGVSFIGPLQPLRATTGYNAFKIARPKDRKSTRL